MTTVSNLIKRINGAVAARGYFAGWSANQIIARNIAKLAEETGELAELINLPELAGNEIERARMFAKQAFDNKKAWGEVGSIDPENVEKIKKEIADIFVVMSVLTAWFSNYYAPDFDPMAAAVEKAEADIARGVRKSGD